MTAWFLLAGPSVATIFVRRTLPVWFESSITPEFPVPPSRRLLICKRGFAAPTLIWTPPYHRFDIEEYSHDRASTLADNQCGNRKFGSHICRVCGMQRPKFVQPSRRA